MFPKCLRLADIRIAANLVGQMLRWLSEGAGLSPEFRRSILLRVANCRTGADSDPPRREALQRRAMRIRERLHGS